MRYKLLYWLTPPVQWVCVIYCISILVELHQFKVIALLKHTFAMGVRNAEHLKIIVYIWAPQDAAKLNATFQQCVRNAVHLKIVVELGAIKVATSANATFASSVANAMHLQIRRNTYKKRWCKGQRHLCKVCAQSTACQMW